MPTGDDEQPAWLQVAAAVVAVVVLGALYLIALRLTIDATRLDASHTANARDLLYLGIHAAGLLFALCLGFVTGKWVNGHGLAYAAFCFGALAVLMLTVMAGSEVLACDHDRNDLVRHWECTKLTGDR